MIKLIKSTFYNEKLTKEKLCGFIMSADQLSFGAQCKLFEENFAKYQGRKFCVSFNSGSSANLALIQALVNLGKAKKGEFAAFSAVTWSTNVMPLVQVGLSPIPVDVELQTLNVSSRTFLNTLQKFPVKMLFLTNLLGFCDDIDEIQRICEKKKILLVEDNCESLGTVYKGKKLGNYSFASTFSFYTGHHMSTIEGGAVCTDDEDLYVMLHIVRAHGWDRNLNPEYQKKLRNVHKVEPFYDLFTFYDLGYNLRPTEITAFLGNLQLNFIDEIVNKRYENFRKIAIPLYLQIDKYYPLKYNHIELLSNFAIPLICKSKEVKKELINQCQGKIEIRPILGGNMLRQPISGKYLKESQKIPTPNADIIHDLGFYFANNPELTKEEIIQIYSTFL